MDFLVLQGDSLACYLKYAETTDEKLFGYSLLFIRYILAGSKPEAEKIYLDYIEAFPLPSYGSPFYLSFYIYSRVLYQKCFVGMVSPEYVEHVYLMVELICQNTKLPKSDIVLFLFLIVNCLHHCELYESVVYVVKNMQKKYFQLSEHLKNTAYYPYVSMLFAHSLLKMNEVERANPLFKHLKFDSHYSNSRHYWTIRYYFIQIDFLRQNPETKPEELVIIQKKIEEIARYLKYRFYEERAKRLDISIIKN